MNVYKALDLDLDKLDAYSKDDIKQQYKKIALECHPDKLSCIMDDAEKNEKVDKFKQASIAYKVLLDDFDKYGKIICRSDEMPFEYDFECFKDDFEIYKDFDMQFWESTIDMIKNKDFLKNTFMDIAGFFLKNNLHTKKYYSPEDQEVIQHKVVLPVSYCDLHKKSKKKVRLILKDVGEPVFLNIYCRKEYPCIERQYIDDDGKEHNIWIDMKIDYSEGVYTHIVKGDGCIDLITNIDVMWVDYLVGCVKHLEYIDGGFLEIVVKAFSDDKIVLSGKGLFGGDLVININIINIKEKEWKKLDENHKRKLIGILKMI
jgi:DnaJ-class molecular chaperone